MRKITQIISLIAIVGILLSTLSVVPVTAQTAEPDFLQLGDPLDRIQYYVPGKTSLGNPTIRDSYLRTLKLTPSQPQTRFTIIANFNSTFARQFFKETFPVLQAQYADTVEFQMVPATFSYFDKTIEMNTLALIECLKLQNAFWPNVTTLAEYSETPTDTSRLQNVDQTELSACLKSITTYDKENMYQDALKSLPTFRFNGIPAFVVEDATVNDKMGILLFGTRPAPYFTAAFERIHQKLSNSQIKQLQIDYQNQQAELATAQEKITLYENLSLWQKLKLLVGIKPL